MLHEIDPPVRVSDDLFLEAQRQLNICNACRYCEGYCAVFPALERRTLLSKGDILHLANLCHDCRDCYYACPYSPPHAFSVNPPQIFTEIRLNTYDEGLGVYEKRLPLRLRGWGGFSLAMVAALSLVVAIAWISEGASSMWSTHISAASPYSVVPYAGILILALVPFLFSVLAMAFSARRFWRDTQGDIRSKRNLKALWNAIFYAGELRYLKGGGVGCSYPKDEMSASRRRFHSLTFYGFSALVLSTVSAGILQDVLGSVPPYSLISVPVILGVTGGLSMVIGSSALIILKTQADPAPTNHRMALRDYGFLVALDLLGVSGLLTLLLRSTSAFGAVFVVHLSIVVVAFAIAPYTKFVHFIYRFLAIVRDNLEGELE